MILIKKSALEWLDFTKYMKVGPIGLRKTLYLKFVVSPGSVSIPLVPTAKIIRQQTDEYLEASSINSLHQ